MLYLSGSNHSEYSSALEELRLKYVESLLWCVGVGSETHAWVYSDLGHSVQKGVGAFIAFISPMQNTRRV